MKAYINGITLEGTPQEIAEYQRILDEKEGLEKKAFIPSDEFCSIISMKAIKGQIKVGIK